MNLEILTKSESLNIQKDILARSHPTVWKEMQRQASYYLKLNELFSQAPEALEW